LPRRMHLKKKRKKIKKLKDEPEIVVIEEPEELFEAELEIAKMTLGMAKELRRLSKKKPRYIA